MTRVYSTHPAGATEGLKAERVRRAGSYGVGAADCGGGGSLDEKPSIPQRTMTSLWHALESMWSP
ncbi:hypothetical protein IMZ48_21320 [Candidatus Bathyarchaeota archaeon]|nr:hypothetical protein [Candidatus Bathyarchaeota archaeon]